MIACGECLCVLERFEGVLISIDDEVICEREVERLEDEQCEQDHVREKV